MCIAMPSHDQVNNALTKALKIEAARLGFVACGITPADAVPGAGERLRQWLADGCHGEMIWMADRAAQRASPQALWPEVRSVIMLGMSYAPPRDRSRWRRSGHAAASRSRAGPGLS